MSGRQRSYRSTSSSLFLIVAVAATSVSCGRADARASMEPPPVPVRTELAGASSDPCRTELTGTLRAERRIDLAFKVAGYVTNVAHSGARLLEVGDRVQQGQVLATVRATDYTAKSTELSGLRAQANAAVVQADLEEGRASRLLATGAISRAEYDVAKNRLDAARGSESAAKAGLSQADILLADTRLIAPFDSVVLARQVEPGTLAAAGTPAFSLGIIDTLRIDVAVSEASAQTLSPGSEVPFRVVGATDQRVARVFTVSPRVDPRTRLVPVELTLKNEDLALRDGRPVQVTIPDACPNAAALVPVASLVRAAGSDGRLIVWVCNAERGRSRAQRREVVVTGLVGARAAIASGITAGERVITAGATLVSESTDVEVLP
jgi:RND family efflux transporter MFP subunit